MPVKVRIEKKRPAPVKFTAADFAHPDQRRARLLGLAAGLAAVAAVMGLLLFVPFNFYLMGAWAAWILAAIYAYAILGPRRELRAAGAGPRPRSTGPLSEMVAAQARALGVSATVVESDQAETLITVGRCIIVPAGLRERLKPGEMWALLAREMAFIKAREAGLCGMTRRLQRESRLLLRLLGLPLRPLLLALANWRWYAELSADRMALVLTRDRKLLAGALLKQATARTGDIGTEEIDSYLSRPGAITAQSADVTTHFKLGEVLRERGDLADRLRGIARYAESADYKAACDKLDAAYREAHKTQEGIPAPPSGPPASA